MFRLEPETGIVESVAQDFRQPNGLAFSNDEKLLYVTESGSSHDATIPAVIRVYDVVGESALGNGRDFAEIDNGLPDGIRVDCYGNVWSSAADGVHCFDPGGKLLGKVLVPETVSNLTFGGARGDPVSVCVCYYWCVLCFRRCVCLYVLARVCARVWLCAGEY